MGAQGVDTQMAAWSWSVDVPCTIGMCRAKRTLQRVDLLGLRHAPSCRLETKDIKGRTPLARAAARGNWEMCRFLIACGADLTATDNNGHVPREIAAKVREWPTAPWFVGRGRIPQVHEDTVAASANTSLSYPR